MTNTPPAVSVGVRGRIEAARRLSKISNDGSFAGLVGNRHLPAEVERVATGLVGGVTRWRRWLDHLASSCYKGHYDDLEHAVKEILRIGTYDLAVVGTAPHAAVNQAVEAARQEIRQGAANLVNAVLRALDRKKPWLTAMSGDSTAELAVRWSHPDWLVERWLERFGPEDTRRLLEHNNSPPVFSVRVAGRRDEFELFLSEEHVPWEQSSFLDDYIRVERLQPVLRGGWIQHGSCTVQDESAGLVVRLLDPKPGEQIVDACAAPGGKTRYIAERMDGTGLLKAIDSNKARLEKLERVIVSTPIQSIVTDFRDFASHNPGTADRVLVDAPCTGLGVLASRADLRWHRSLVDFETLGPIQAGLLDAGAAVVKPDGVFVYSTCSIAPEENETQVRAFLDRHPEMQLESAAELLPKELVTQEGYFASLPHRDHIDGAFGARFRRLA
ncbi:MAG: 16S rRNA (cytosine967-C5)-methyltransferase [Thalassolituus oleivorans]|jgi:16S rRNA (cytosine967-C5)-methyltransferase